MARQPPFSAESSNFNSDEKQTQTLSLLPPSYRDTEHIHHHPEKDISAFLAQDLSVTQLNEIHSYLWMAGRPLPPRPLNFHVSTSRIIIPDERTHMHLVWGDSRRIHLKPLPRYLLNYQFWENHICCGDKGESNATQPREIYANAIGFLYSYIALLQHESDFAAARESHLIPETLKWESWVLLVQDALARGEVNHPNFFNPRYQFGELRLSRLNLICRIFQGAWLRGYDLQFQTYSELFEAYIAPLSMATIYLALALAAMQTGLATDYLGQSQAFQSASYGVALVGLLLPLALLVLLAIVALVAFIVNLLRALICRHQRFKFYSRSRSPG
ncbi:hypothetical protein FQN54_006492 [Arachnomyces sp. PD_36]|nr:hypothetical protein FQN54_006492 [Arachnomyces sp. PD_36]